MLVGYGCEFAVRGLTCIVFTWQYLHADIHGAATHIIKNHTKEAVPPLTLAQAGLSCVCRSAAWNARMVTSAYWVHPEQASLFLLMSSCGRAAHMFVLMKPYANMA